SSLHNPAGEHSADLKLCAGFSRIRIFALITEYQTACSNMQLGKQRETVDDGFSDTVGEIFSVRVCRVMREGQNGDRIHFCKFLRTEQHSSGDENNQGSRPDSDRPSQ